jgi:hypothetical protein
LETAWREVGRTVRAAIKSWPETIRLCVILAAGTALITILLAYNAH